LKVVIAVLLGVFYVLTFIKYDFLFRLCIDKLVTPRIVIDFASLELSCNLTFLSFFKAVEYFDDPVVFFLVLNLLLLDCLHLGCILKNGSLALGTSLQLH
jgi:hypothetical protein